MIYLEQIEREYLEDQIHFLVELLTEDQLEEYMQFLKSNDYGKD